jgi:hypothetical protein
MGRLTTVDLLIKITCFVKKIFQYKKKLTLTSEYKEVKCTDPSPSVRIPWTEFLTRLLIVVVPVATTKIMALHDELKTLICLWHSYLLSLNIDTHGLSLLRINK